jgi:hypothetical protein
MAIFPKTDGPLQELRLVVFGSLALLAVAAAAAAIPGLPGANLIAVARNRSVMTLDDDGNYYDAVQGRRIAKAAKFIRSADFRSYRAAPYLDWHSGGVSTNRFGRPGPDRPAAKPANTWRVAVLGDSLVSGYRIPDADTMVAMFEERLNREEAGVAGERFEVMNFACPGYSVPQMLDTEVEDVPAYHPDALLVELSERSLYKQWDLQLAAVAARGIDPKYDFVRRVF